tara:strand:+ start:22317 stop:24992 length:2676 start_codon:yes stop_codon:yes gene_type:complete
VYNGFLNFIVIVFICTKFSCYGQSILKGKVNDSIGNSVAYSNVIVKSYNKQDVVTYTYSNEKGDYLIKIIETGKFNIIFSALGYASKIVPIELIASGKEIDLDIVLKSKTFELNEVIVNVSKPITIKKDTIVFNVKSFLKGNEQVVEDLLKNIPGININNEGIIKIGNQEVEKVMIDGDDFFEKGYKILTKNMPVNPIEKVEILQRYSNNKLLKGVEKSDKVALNLVLKEGAKHQWFGSLNVGYGMASKNRYDIQSNLMNFGKKNKFYFLTNINNVGYNATGDVNHLIRPYRYGEPASIGDNESAASLLDLGLYTPNFKASRTNFNNAELLSLNAIFTPSKKVKVKTLGFFNWDENDFFRNSSQTYSVNETSFTNIEDYTLRKKKFTGFGKIDVTYDISKTKMLEITSKYNNKEENTKSNLVFNGDFTNEKLRTTNTLFDIKATFTNKFKPTKVLLLTGRYIHEKTPQNYAVNQFFYQDLFPSLNTINNVEQTSENQLQFVGFEAHLLDRKENGDLLELQFGNQFRKDKLLSTLFLKEMNTIVEEPTAYQNNTVYSSNDLYFNSKYRLKIKDFSITGKIDAHQLFNQLELNTTSKQQPFFINPGVSLDWEINKKNKIVSSYSYNTTNATVLDVYKNPVLTSYRSFSKGTGAFNQLEASTLLFNYQLGNWSDKFFANTFIIYTKNHDFFSTNSFITQNYSQSEKIIIKNREMLSVSAEIDRYLKDISSNLKLDLGYSKYNFKNIVNNSDLREVESNNYNYGLELRSGFKGFFNYHLGTKWTINEIKTTIKNSFTDNISFLDLSFVFSNTLTLQFESERYYFGNVDEKNSIYYFSDFNAKYTIKENKLTLSLSGENLFNTKTFKSYSISDVDVSTTEYKLLPRYVLLKMVYRF